MQNRGCKIRGQVPARISLGQQQGSVEYLHQTLQNDTAATSPTASRTVAAEAAREQHVAHAGVRANDAVLVHRVVHVDNCYNMSMRERCGGALVEPRPRPLGPDAFEVRYTAGKALPQTLPKRMVDLRRLFAF